VEAAADRLIRHGEWREGIGASRIQFGKRLVQEVQRRCRRVGLK
jgi:hypothetical protein